MQVQPVGVAFCAEEWLSAWLAADTGCFDRALQSEAAWGSCRQAKPQETGRFGRPPRTKRQMTRRRSAPLQCPPRRRRISDWLLPPLVTSLVQGFAEAPDDPPPQHPLSPGNMSPPGADLHRRAGARGDTRPSSTAEPGVTPWSPLLAGAGGPASVRRCC